MKIAIHHRKGSFSDTWISYCERSNISYKIVDAFDNNIISEVKDCDCFLWHHHHGNFKDAITAKRILFSLQHAGVKVYPDFKTGWHFDDKVAQKYLLEAINAPLVPSFVFYNESDAIKWSEEVSYPKVWKLKGGAGASNVKLIKTENHAKRLIRKAFKRGFSQFNSFNHLKDKFLEFRANKNNVFGVLKGFYRVFVPTKFARQLGREKGYVYFQEFIPNNEFDIRVVVINGEFALAEKRFVRKNDFRASGSGKFSYENINLKAIELAFAISQDLKLQSVAFDFVLNESETPLIVELSYGFGLKGLKNAPGYWNSKLEWQNGSVDCAELIIKNVIESLHRKD